MTTDRVIKRFPRKGGDRAEREWRALSLQATCAPRPAPADPGDQTASRPGAVAGEWEIPPVPSLRYERAVLAGAVLKDHLRTARRTGRAPYDATAHQQAALPEQLSLFDQDGTRPARKAGPLDATALRTGREALELTAGQVRVYQQASEAFATAGAAVRERMQHNGAVPRRRRIEPAPRSECAPSAPARPGPAKRCSPVSTCCRSPTPDAARGPGPDVTAGPAVPGQ
ncbi:hypothetical protein ACTPOK_42505 [Streptomyces inhibens]|uniref:hypothetical protein n=1 Tax=Streptomyces inhibens TaxID=2293571 RepID=UPI00402A9928